MWWLTTLAALGADVDVERSLAATRENRTTSALAAIRPELGPQATGDAWTAYLLACAGAGIAPACEQEARLAGDVALLAALRLRRLAEGTPALPESGDPTWLGLASGEPVDHPLSWAERAGVLARSDPNAGVALANEGFSAHPQHPEIFAPLFAADRAAAPALGKLAKKLAKQGSKRVGKAEAAEVYRWLSLAVALEDEALGRLSADRLASLGEPAVRPRASATPAARQALVQAALDGPAGSAVPSFDPVEHQLVIRALVATLLERGETERALQVVTKARETLDHVELALLQAQLLDGTPGAVRSADDALRLGLVTLDDRAASQLDALRDRVARALAARGSARTALDDLEGAAVDLMLANQIAPAPVEPAALELAMGRGMSTLRSVKESLETRREGAHERGLAEARAAIEAGDDARAEALLGQVVAALCVPPTAKVNLSAALPGRVFIAEALAMRGQLETRDRLAARTDLTMAVLLRRYDAPAAWWGALAEVHDEPEARFFAVAMAGALGEQAVALPQWNGKAEAAAPAATALVSRWMRTAPESEDGGLVVSRGIVMNAPRPGSRTGSGGGGGAPNGGVAPALNTPFPAFQLETEHGAVGMRPGRITILVFLRSDSPSSRRAMHELSVLTRDFRKLRGTDAVVLGVVVDPVQNRMDENLPDHVTAMWGPYAWNPDLGKRFDVDAVPTIYVIDSHGIARFAHVGYLGTSEYVAELRLLAGN